MNDFAVAQSESGISGPPAAPEPVRLVIWDLDETFWDGTLTEGGIAFRQDRLEIVTALAKRGIISSICSKNDFEQVREILAAHGAWDYFVFPSISWEPKGPRIARLIEDFQLRAATVLFLDDNPLNLEEAKHFSPQLQVATHTHIPALLDDPLLKGKDDEHLTRLHQYKTLEKRKHDAAETVDTDEFLRASEIKVRLEFDLLKHLDRAIELINRTNQLNFTKTRLPENQEEARAELAKLLSDYRYQGALVQVTDRYGDHGFAGLYIHDSEERQLVQFCFSCRILGMGVEQWLYQRIGRPRLKIAGEVLSDPTDTSRVIDWISLAAGHQDRSERGPAPADLVVARGACDLGAVIHYFSAMFPEAIGEYHAFRHNTVYRTDHSIFLRYLIDGISPEALSIAERLGYQPGDFTSRIFEAPGERAVVLLGLHSDAYCTLYRHRHTGLRIPMFIGGIPASANLCEPLANVPEPNPTHWTGRALAFLRAEFDCEGQIGKYEFKANVRLALDRIPPQTRVFLLEIYTNDILKDGAIRRAPKRFHQIKKWLRDVAKRYPNVTRLDLADYVRSDSEVIDHLHFNRMVYFRLYQDIVRRLRE